MAWGWPRATGSPGGSTHATLTVMDTVGLRELRQSASEIMRRVEAGESITVTVSGRAVATLVPPGRRSWRRYDEIEDLFAGPDDPSSRTDRERVDDQVQDPWTR